MLAKIDGSNPEAETTWQLTMNWIARPIGDTGRSQSTTAFPVSCRVAFEKHGHHERERSTRILNDQRVAERQVFSASGLCQ